jgi:sugar-binding transcriptional regulator, lacI family protein
MKEKKKSITMKDVALEAGVSVGTVSRVINKEQGIKEVTLKKVRQAIEKLSYVPDHYARGMKKNRTETIALIIPSIWHPFFSEFAMHVENEVSKRNNKLLLCSINGTDREKFYLEMLRQNKVDGIIAITYSPIEDYLISGIPFVSVDRIYSDLNLPCVSSDNEAGGAEAAKQLIEKGCRHIAFVGAHNKTINETKKRRISFEKFALEQNHPFSIFDLDEKVIQFKIKLEHFLKENPQIDGIFAINDFTALDTIEILESLQIKVPDDVQVIGYDGIKLAEDRDFLLSTIQQPVEEMAREAVAVLFSILENEPYSLQTILPIKYVEGKTTKN